MLNRCCLNFFFLKCKLLLSSFIDFQEFESSVSREQNFQQYFQPVEPEGWHVPVHVVLVHWKCITGTTRMAKYLFFGEVTVS